ncbi:MAG: DUF167 domain-containing protein [Chloroflexi bacterium]|nr:DUF167 domain-containing protein [Chloroflexota bacterium]
MPTTRIRVRVQPRAKVNQVLGMANGVLQVRIAAPPIEGQANNALEEFLAERLDMPQRQVRVVRGAASRSKLVELEGMSEEEALRRLGQS